MKLAFLAVASFVCASTPETSGLKKLNLVALDSHGQPVTDLKASDLQISEDGKQKEIAYFHFTGGKSSPPTVILIDLLSDRVLSDSVMGKEVAEALKKLETGDDVYVYFLTNHGDLFPARGLPEEGDESAAGAAQNTGAMIDLAVKKIYGLRPVADIDPGVRFNMTAKALDALGGQMELFRGRKNLVWVTHGPPLTFPSLTGQPVDMTSQVSLLAEKMEQAQMVVYAVQQATNGAGEGLASEGGRTLELFANLTGGRKYGSDYVGPAIAQARTDARANYVVAYETDAANAGGKRHKIKVTSKRKDVHFVTEQEYYALGLQLTAAEFEKAAVEEATNSARDAGEIGVRAKAGATISAGTGRSEQFDLQIDTADVMLRRVQDHYVGKVSVVFETYEKGAPAWASPPVALNVNLTAAQYEAAMRGTLAFEQTVPIGAQVEKVRAIVVDSELRAVGTVTIPVAPK